jgi:hypothetical protein
MDALPVGAKEVQEEEEDEGWSEHASAPHHDHDNQRWELLQGVGSDTDEATDVTCPLLTHP